MYERRYAQMRLAVMFWAWPPLVHGEVSPRLRSTEQSAPWFNLDDEVLRPRMSNGDIWFPDSGDSAGSLLTATLWSAPQ